jgi:hypothetical protein
MILAIRVEAAALQQPRRIGRMQGIASDGAGEMRFIGGHRDEPRGAREAAHGEGIEAAVRPARAVETVAGEAAEARAGGDAPRMAVDGAVAKPDVEQASQIEFRAGASVQAGGRERPHEVGGFVAAGMVEVPLQGGAGAGAHRIAAAAIRARREDPGDCRRVTETVHRFGAAAGLSTGKVPAEDIKIWSVRAPEPAGDGVEGFCHRVGLVLQSSVLRKLGGDHQTENGRVIAVDVGVDDGRPVATGVWGRARGSGRTRRRSPPPSRDCAGRGDPDRPGARPRRPTGRSRPRRRAPTRDRTSFGIPAYRRSAPPEIPSPPRLGRRSFHNRRGKRRTSRAPPAARAAPACVRPRGCARPHPRKPPRGPGSRGRGVRPTGGK